jgi:hypothetical protein
MKKRTKNKIIKIISGIAPTIATVLGGPLPGNAIKALIESFGLDDNSDDIQILSALENDPEAIFKLKQLDYDYKKSFDEKEIKIEELKNEDLSNARQMREKLKDPIATLLAIVIMIYFGAILYQVIVVGITNQNEMLVGALIGCITTAFTGLVVFHFGSSAGSKQKTNLLSKLEED